MEFFVQVNIWIFLIITSIVYSWYYKTGLGGGRAEGGGRGRGAVVVFFLLVADLCAVIAPLVQPAGNPRSSFTSVAY